MRRLSLILSLALGLVATTAHTEETTSLLEGLLQEQRPMFKKDDLEKLVYEVKKSSLQTRIEKFFVKHKVKRPQFYAQLIIQHPMPEAQKKTFAAIIVPESRGDANAVSYAGAQGPWQVMPAWKKRLKIKGSLKDPATNLNAAVKVYNIHAADARHDPHKTLVYYSGRTPGYATKVQWLASTI